MDSKETGSVDLRSFIAGVEERLNVRLDGIDKKLDTVAKTRHKSMEWIATLSEQIESLDEFREEVRASFEPFVRKLDGIDEVMRILRHATSDVSRRMESIEREQRKRLAG